MMKGLMREKGVMSFETLMKTEGDFGVAKFLQEAGSSKVTLFI